MVEKIIKIIAGPNGSGKTTFAESFIFQAEPNIPFLNPDLIASGFGPMDFEKASFQAGRVLLTDIRARISRGESKVLLNISRIQMRVSQGGHFIPTPVLRRQYLRCFVNFWHLYREHCDAWYILDNSKTRPVLVKDIRGYLQLPENDRLKFEKKFLKGQV